MPMNNVLVAILLFLALAFISFCLLVCWSCLVVGAHYDEASERYANLHKRDMELQESAAPESEKRQPPD